MEGEAAIGGDFSGDWAFVSRSLSLLRFSIRELCLEDERSASGPDIALEDVRGDRCGVRCHQEDRGS